MLYSKMMPYESELDGGLFLDSFQIIVTNPLVPPGLCQAVAGQHRRASRPCPWRSGHLQCSADPDKRYNYGSCKVYAFVRREVSPADSAIKSTDFGDFYQRHWHDSVVIKPQWTIEMSGSLYRAVARPPRTITRSVGI